MEQVFPVSLLEMVLDCLQKVHTTHLLAQSLAQIVQEERML